MLKKPCVTESIYSSSSLEKSIIYGCDWWVTTYGGGKPNK